MQGQVAEKVLLPEHGCGSGQVDQNGQAGKDARVLEKRMYYKAMGTVSGVPAERSLGS